MINYHFKGLYKTTYYKESPTFLSFSFLIDCFMSDFPPFKAFINFEKLIIGKFSLHTKMEKI